MSTAISDPPVKSAFAKIGEGCKFLNVGRSTINKLIKDGTLTPKKFPGVRAVRIPWAQLRALAGTEG